MCLEKPKIAVVILAAGEAKRFGSPKQLTEWFGEPLLLALVRKVELCGYMPYLALGAHRDLIVQQAGLEGYKERIIIVKDWSSGLSASIKAAVTLLSERECQGIVFLLADQPMITADYLKRLCSEAERMPNQLIATAYDVQGRERGVPAYFPAGYFQHLNALQKGQGAKKILFSESTVVLQHDNSLMDIDEPEDLVRARKLYQKGC